MAVTLPSSVCAWKCTGYFSSFRCLLRCHLSGDAAPVNLSPFLLIFFMLSEMTISSYLLVHCLYPTLEYKPMKSGISFAASLFLKQCLTHSSYLVVQVCFINETELKKKLSGGNIT